ncbi:MAG: winged helix-turn-helix domain-containing protein [Microbacterium sp.]
MADRTRSRSLVSLLERPSYPAVLSRSLKLSRSNVSNHHTSLRDYGIVVAEPEGRQIRYEIADPRLTASGSNRIPARRGSGSEVVCSMATPWRWMSSARGQASARIVRIETLVTVSARTPRRR